MTAEPITDCVVLGGGIAGLSATKALRAAGLTARIYEARDRAGGLLDNFEIGGFSFDQGVHLSFAKEPEARAVFDLTPSFTHRAEAFCWDRGMWLRHPAQNNMHPLPTDDKIRLIAGLARAQVEAVPDLAASYRDWLTQQYGEPIATRWPLAYTEKYWSLDAAHLGTAWIGARMRPADLNEVLRGAFEPDPPSTYYLSDTRYPCNGGYRAFIMPLIDCRALETNARAVRVDLASRHIDFADGRRTGYRHLISTIPLPELVGLIKRVPSSIREDAASLFATTLDLVSIGFRRVIEPPSLWLYIYDRDIFAARVHAPHRKSPHNVPAGCGSLQFEIYSSRDRPQRHDPATLIANCVTALRDMGIARPEDVLFADHRRVAFANVVFDLGMEERRDRVRAWLATQQIQLAGRFGEWDYLWSNQAMISGLHAAGRVIAATSAHERR